MPNPISTMLLDPTWLAHRYDAEQDAVHFRQVPRAMHADAPFLTDEYLGGAGAITPYPFGDAVARAPAGDIHFIFHSAFCASTLLTRALDLPGIAMGLSEPVILNDIVGFRKRGADPRAVARVLSGALSLLARPFAPGEKVIVKPSNLLNPMADAILRLRPQSRGLILYAPLPIFLASIARKGLWCRIWARQLLESYLREGFVDLGFEPDGYFRLTDLQVAAVGWIAQHKMFEHLRTVMPGRILLLDSETLLGQPFESLSQITRHYGLQVADIEVERIVAGPAFTRHSKFGQAFSAEERAQERAAAAAAHGDEIAKVDKWARAVAENAGLSLTS